MKKIKYSILSVAMVALALGHAGDPPPPVTVLGINDLRAIDALVDEKLKEAGYTCDPAWLSLRITEDSAELTEDAPSPAPCRSRPRDLISAGMTASSIYMLGGNLSWAHASRKKDKIMFHIDLGIAGSPTNYNASLSFDKHIGKKGFFVGANGQLLFLTNTLVDGSPQVMIPAGGLELGWMKHWGQSGRVVTTVKLGMSGTQYEYGNYLWPEGKVGVGVLLFKRSARERVR